MANRFKKIIFPFYKERHGFLVQKWWFRAIILIYFLWLLISPFYIGISHLNSSTGWCFNSAEWYLEKGRFDIWDVEFDKCQQLWRQTWFQSIGVGVVGALLLNISIQFLFFKAIMDFIVLGVRFNKSAN